MHAKPITAENLGELMARVVAYGAAMEDEDRAASYGLAPSILGQVHLLILELGEGAGIGPSDIDAEYEKARARWIDDD